VREHVRPGLVSLLKCLPSQALPAKPYKGDLLLNRTVFSIALVSIALPLGPTLLTAQTAAAPGNRVSQTIVLTLTPPAANCPVSLRAQQMPGGDRWVVSGASVKPLAQRLHLTATAPHSGPVVAANITVRGYAGKPRFTPVGTSDQDAGEAARTLDVAFAPARGRDASTDIALAGFSAVTVVDLNSITYSDGSTWKLNAGSSCRTWIDGTMLIAAH
jgi:hypothetical protein